jgi:hypothetical protein
VLLTSMILCAWVPFNCLMAHPMGTPMTFVVLKHLERFCALHATKHVGDGIW